VSISVSFYHSAVILFEVDVCGTYFLVLNNSDTFYGIMEYIGCPILTHVVTYRGNYRVNGANDDRRPDINLWGV
jgi:hypothetical protein